MRGQRTVQKPLGVRKLGNGKDVKKSSDYAPNQLPLLALEY